MDIFHHYIDVEIHHPVDRCCIGIDQITADVDTGIGMENIELAGIFQYFRQVITMEDATKNLFLEKPS